MINFRVLLLAGLFPARILFAQNVVTQPKIAYNGHNDLLEAVAFSPDGKYVLSGSWDRGVNMYGADSSYLFKRLEGHNSAVMNIAYSRSRLKPSVFATGSKDFSVRLWDSAGNFIRDFVGYTTAVTAIAVDASSKFLYTGSSNQGINVWDISTGSQFKKFNIIGVNALACARDNKTLFVGTNSGDVTVVNLLTGPAAVGLKGHKDAVNALEISYSGKYLVSGSSDKTAIVWEVSSGKVVSTLKGHSWKVTSVAVSRDDKYIVTGSNDGTAKLWELATGKLLASFEGYGFNVRSVAISPDNTKVAVASYERGVESQGLRIFETGIAAKAATLKPAASDSLKTKELLNPADSNQKAGKKTLPAKKQ